jgi:hypothetical protein
MPEKTNDEQIAAARYALIAPVVSRQTPLAPGELKTWLRETGAAATNCQGADST